MNPNAILTALLIGMGIGVGLAWLMDKQAHSWLSMDVRIPLPIVEMIREMAVKLKWTPAKAFRKIMLYGMTALQMYIDNDGGIATIDEFGQAHILPIESDDDKGLGGPFEDFINKMDFD